MSAILLLVGVWWAHYAYYHWPSSGDQQWAHYIGSHALLVLALVLLVPQAARSRWAVAAVIGPIACWWGAIESAQAAVCGYMQWGTLPAADLCVSALGVWPYALAAALSIATLVVAHVWRRRHG